jgi:hypothetical protein
VHLLAHDADIAGLVRFAALATLVLSVLLGGWLCAVMARSRAGRKAETA